MENEQSMIEVSHNSVMVILTTASSIILESIFLRGKVEKLMVFELETIVFCKLLGKGERASCNGEKLDFIVLLL